VVAKGITVTPVRPIPAGEAWVLIMFILHWTPKLLLMRLIVAVIILLNLAKFSLHTANSLILSLPTKMLSLLGDKPMKQLTI